MVAALALASVGGGYATLGAAADAGAVTMPGGLIDVGGHRLHLSCTGSGTPTVVIEAGGGEMSSNLAWVTQAVALDTRVCVYDRAGRGWSEPAGETAQDATQIAADLHTLLQRGGVPGPYVLAGHSFGGLYALTFADRYPDEVAGMVLVDSTAPAKATTSPATSVSATGSSVIGRASTLVSTVARLGLGRLYAHVAFDTLPHRAEREVRANLATAGNLRSTIDEYVQANVSMREAASLVDFGDKPLVVVTAGVGSGATHLAAQDHLATLSTASAHRVIDGATHGSLVADEDDAAATSRAIIDVVSSVRAEAPLTP